MYKVYFSVGILTDQWLLILILVDNIYIHLDLRDPWISINKILKINKSKYFPNSMCEQKKKNVGSIHVIFNIPMLPFVFYQHFRNAVISFIKYFGDIYFTKPIIKWSKYLNLTIRYNWIPIKTLKLHTHTHTKTKNTRDNMNQWRCIRYDVIGVLLDVFVTFAKTPLSFRSIFVYNM